MFVIDDTLRDQISRDPSLAPLRRHAASQGHRPMSYDGLLKGERHGRYYKLLRAFEDRTGCAAVINTSFNVRGEPIVCSPEHAYRCFMATNMDVLVIENYLLLKKNQPSAKEHEVDEYIAQFDLD